MMKTFALALAALSCAAVTPALAAGFTGNAAPGYFSVANSGTLDPPAAAGSASFSAIDLVMRGADSLGAGCLGGMFSVLGPCELSVTRSMPGTFNFDWSYTSNDGAGPAGDWFGVTVDGVRTLLSDLGGAVAQSGTGVSLTAAHSFSWFINCTDCTSGNAVVQITNFSTDALPEPAGWALLLGAIAALGLTRARRR